MARISPAFRLRRRVSVCSFARGAVLLALVPQCRLIPRDGQRDRPSPVPRRYACHRTADQILVDGRLDEAAWRQAPPMQAFVDIRGEHQRPPRYLTRSWLLWDDERLYIAAQLHDPNVRASISRRDDIVYFDNDFEVFIDPDGDARDYVEIEVNALNTIFDLLLERTYREGGPARHEWNVDGLLHAVVVDGTLNDPSDVDRGWAVEMAIPWRALAPFPNGSCPPRIGDVWRMNFSRVQWPDDMPGGSAELAGKGIEDNWVWSPQGEVNMHVPQRWGFVEFLPCKSSCPTRRPGNAGPRHRAGGLP